MIDLSKVIYHNVTQGSVDWLDLRLSRITGTRTKTLTSKLTAADKKAGRVLNAGCFTLVDKIVSEKLTNISADSDFKSWKMERGNELEPDARQRYQEEFLEPVQEIGFISCGEHYGISLDGKVADSGLLEIKCPLGPEYIRMYKLFSGLTEDQKIALIKPEYMTQMQWGLMITGREFQDNWYYNPDFPLGHQTLNIRVFRDNEMIKVLKDKAHLVEMEVEKVLQVFAA